MIRALALLVCAAGVVGVLVETCRALGGPLGSAHGALWALAPRLPRLPEPEVLVAATCVGLCGASAITSCAALCGVAWLVSSCGCAP